MYYSIKIHLYVHFCFQETQYLICLTHCYLAVEWLFCDFSGTCCWDLSSVIEALDSAMRKSWLFCCMEICVLYALKNHMGSLKWLAYWALVCTHLLGPNISNAFQVLKMYFLSHHSFLSSKFQKVTFKESLPWCL